jgi:hypothetical protein
MEPQKLHHLVLEFLRKEGPPTGNVQFSSLIIQINEFAQSKGIIQQNENFSGEEAEQILDVFNALFQQGVLRWGLNEGNPAPPFIGLTSYGKKVLESTDPIPHDPYDYLGKLEKRVPNLHDNAKMYLIESIQTFLTNNFMASAVMLGVAAEATFNEMYDTLIHSIQSNKVRSKLEQIRESANTKRRIDLFRQTILVTYKSIIPHELTDDFESKTDPLFNLMRQIRNDVGHPTGIKVDWMTMFINLQIFVPFCETAYKWIEFLKKTTFQ